MKLVRVVAQRMKIFNTKIKEHRAKLDLKQEDLASLVNVRRETIGNVENGRYNPSLKLAMDIAEVFGCKVEDLFTLVKKQK